jgi:hypothetical protein
MLGYICINMMSVRRKRNKKERKLCMHMDIFSTAFSLLGTNTAEQRC